MFTRLVFHLPRQQWRLIPKVYLFSQFHSSALGAAIKPVLLTDIGEGITECEIIQWFVRPETKVEEWDKLCEVSSDKASVEITSRFAGIIKNLHYEAGEMAKVGKPLVDIDIQDESEPKNLEFITNKLAEDPKVQASESIDKEKMQEISYPNTDSRLVSEGGDTKLATPAVRSLLKQLNTKIEDVFGTGKDGRVLTEDVYKFVENRDASSSNFTIDSPKYDLSVDHGTQTETIKKLSSSQNLMFKTMTKSLSIPHFLYADEIDFTSLSEHRVRLNRSNLLKPVGERLKISFLPFIIKALSISLNQYPILNSRVELNETTCKPLAC